MKTHKDLDVWRKSIDLVTEVYRITKNFPKDEVYGLSSQLRRAAVSIPSNIAEGAARNHKKEYIQFLYVALASGSEVDTQLIIASNLNYLSINNYQILSDKVETIQKMLQGLIRSVKGER